MVTIDCASKRNVTLEGRHVRTKTRLVMWVKDGQVRANSRIFKIRRYMILKFQRRNKNGFKVIAARIAMENRTNFRRSRKGEKRQRGKEKKKSLGSTRNRTDGFDPLAMVAGELTIDGQSS